MKIDPALPVAEIARRWPATATVLAKYRIDLCCGGKHPLAFVAEKHKLDVAKLVAELEAAILAKTA
jgi:iron-sulfur cluster repair protein YtfE (RIC family)